MCIRDSAHPDTRRSAEPSHRSSAVPFSDRAGTGREILALVCRIHLHGARSTHKRIDRAGISGRRGVLLPDPHRRVAPMAGIPDRFRAAPFSCHCRAVAHLGGPVKYGRSKRSRIFLVLFRQRALLALSGKALPTRLQQASLGAVLVSASGMAVPVEHVLSLGDPNNWRRFKEQATA